MYLNFLEDLERVATGGKVATADCALGICVQAQRLKAPNPRCFQNWFCAQNYSRYCTKFFQAVCVVYEVQMSFMVSLEFRPLL